MEEKYSDDEEAGELGKPDGVRIDENSPYRVWDPADEDGNNPWTAGKKSTVPLPEAWMNTGTANRAGACLVTSLRADGGSEEHDLALVHAEAAVDWIIRAVRQ